MPVKALEPESSASTNFATFAKEPAPLEHALRAKSVREPAHFVNDGVAVVAAYPCDGAGRYRETTDSSRL